MPAAAGTGGMPPLNIQVRITTSGASAASQAMQNVTRSSSNFSRSMMAGVISTRTLGDAMRMSASLMKYTLAGAFARAGKASIDAYRQFELSFSRIKGLVNMGSDSIEAMKKGVLEMATETTRGPNELANALYFVTSAGIKNASTAMEVLRASAKAAAAGLGETNTVADALTSTLNAYGQANISATEAADVLVATVREGKAEADTFAPALGKVLPVAAAYGATFNDTAAAVAALSRNGMTAGTAAIYVRQTLSQLLKPSKQAQEALAKVGLSTEMIREEVRTKGLFAALQTLSSALGGVEQAADFARVFGNVRALTAVLSLVGPAASENEQIFRRMQNATGDLDYAFQAYTKTVDYKFNQALASQQVALVELGKSVKDIIMPLLDLSIALTKFAKIIAGSGIGKGFIKFAGGITIAILAISAITQTISALIRLSSNMLISLTGQKMMWDASSRTLYVYNASAAQAAATQAGLTAQTTQQTMALAGFVPATNAAATALTRLAMAGQFVMRSLMWIGLAITAFQVIKSIGGALGLFGKNIENTKSFSEAAEGLNEILDETVKFSKSDLVIRPVLDTSEVSLQSDIDRIKQQITEQSPDLLPALNDIFGVAGKESGIIFIKSLMDSMFANQSAPTKKALLAFFKQSFQFDADEYAKAVVPNDVGDKVTAAIQYQAQYAAKAVAGSFDELIVPEEGMSGLVEYINQKFKTDTFGGAINALNEFGLTFSNFINDTGDITPLMVTLKGMQDEFDKTGTAVYDQGKAYEQILGPALQNLSGDFELVQDKGGNLAKVIQDPKNATAIKRFVQASTGITDTTAIYELLVEKTKDISHSTVGAKEAVDVFVEVLGDAVAEQNKSADSAKEMENAFSGLTEEIGFMIENYEAAEGAIKNYEQAQRALMGINLTQEEATRDYIEQLQKVGEAASESGGSIDIRTEKGRETREELQQMAVDLMALANTYAAVGDYAGAGDVFAQGLSQIVAQASKAGIAADDVIAFYESIGVSGDMYAKSLQNQGTNIQTPAEDIGTGVTQGIASGIEKGKVLVFNALGAMSDDMIMKLKNLLETHSPSRRTEREIGKPMAEGIAVGFSKEMKSGKTKTMISKSLDDAIISASKSGGRKGISKYFTDFLKKKEAVETPAQDFVKASIGRMKDIIGSLGDYIKAQLSFRSAQADLAKLINMQRGLDARRRKAAREQQYTETRFGLGGGAQVTGYEQAQIDQLQLDFERVSRDYAMGRATYIDLVDAEIALYEARAAASEVNDDVLSAQNKFIDASVNVENRELELASSTVQVLSAYQDLQEASANLYINHKELKGVYDNLATATGLASGKIQIGNTDITNLGTSVSALGGFSSTVGGYVSTLGANIDTTGVKFGTFFDGEGGVLSTIVKTGTNFSNLTTSIGAGFTNLSRGLLDPNGEMMTILKSLGPGIGAAIQTGAQEALDASPLNLTISVNAQVDKSGNGSVSWTSNVDVPVPTPTSGGRTVAGRYGSPSISARGKSYTYSPVANATMYGRATGGPVASGSSYMVGERGPEMFVPNVSGTIVTTSALERYARVNQANAGMTAAAPANNIVVTVNNPVPAAAEDSITRRMKVLANSGLFG